MQKINEKFTRETKRPIKVMQYGEGNFLRAFVDYMIDIANEKGAFNGDIAIVKPIDFGTLERFKNQDNLYTVILRGKDKGEVVNESRVITSVQKVLDAKEDYDEYMALAKLDTLRFVVSNTTEAGITLDVNDNFEGLPATYPGKLTKFLFERFTFFNGDIAKGLIILPVELIEDNGIKLKKCVKELIKVWALGEAFEKWIDEACVFTSTLVDRIVTGYPRNEAEALCEKLGYKDELLDVGEPFGAWVIESEKDISEEFPLHKIGQPVIFTDNQKPYRERKVRVLNGAHTSSVLAGYLYGLDIVRDCMYDDVMGKYVRKVVDEEIVPEVPLNLEDVKAFANSVYERFENPFIDHALLSISLNSVSKWKSRCLPSLKDSLRSKGQLPKLLTFSFAALLAFYSASDLKEDGLYAKRANGDAYVIHDDKAVMEFFAANSLKDEAEFVKLVCENESFWGENLNNIEGFASLVTENLKAIKSCPVCAIKEIVK